MKRLLPVIPMLAFALCIGGCSKDNPTQNPNAGTLTGVVTSELDGSKVSGVTVRIQETGDTAVSDASGHYTIANVAPGSYNVNATATGTTFETTFTEAVLTAGTTTTLNIVLDSKLPTGQGRIIGRAMDEETGLNLAGVSVRTIPSISVTGLTDSSGYFRMVPVPASGYILIATKAGMIPDTLFAQTVPSQGTLDSLVFSLRDSVSKKGLVAYYKFNGDAKDASGHNNNGTVNGAAPTADRFGNPSGALAFDGASATVTVPSSTDLNLGGPTSDFTISLWAQFNGTQSDNAGIMSKAVDDPFYLINQGYEVYVYKGSSGGYSVGTAFVGQDKVKYYFDGEASFWTDNKWHQVIITVSRSEKTGRRYTNGQQRSTLDLSGGGETQDFGNTLPLTFGKDASGNFYFKGAIDDVRIYNRALTQKEAAMLFHENGWQ